MSSFKMPIIGNLLESIAAEFKDKVKPVPGSVLKCDLAFGADFLGGSLCHTGIYLGGDEIAEITNEDGAAKVNVVDPADFLNGQGTNLIRTGINIYVATDGNGRALGSTKVAKRARAFVELGRRGEYDLVDNNCHKFTVRCVTGEEPDDAKLTERDVEKALEDAFGCSCVTWEPTGFSTTSCSFDDDDGS